MTAILAGSRKSLLDFAMDFAISKHSYLISDVICMSNRVFFFSEQLVNRDERKGEGYCSIIFLEIVSELLHLFKGIISYQIGVLIIH